MTPPKETGTLRAPGFASALLPTVEVPRAKTWCSQLIRRIPILEDSK